MPDKYLYNNGGTLTEKSAVATSSGAGDAGKIPALDSSGKFDSSMMPVGVGSETDVITASEALAAGDFVNIYSSSGIKCRKADATAAGKEACGFVLAAVSNGAQATVYRISQSNTQLTSLTPGAKYYLAATAGIITLTPPSAAGNIVQVVGYAVSATSLVFMPSDPIVLG